MQVQILFAACRRSEMVRKPDDGPNWKAKTPSVSQPYHKNNPSFLLTFPPPLKNSKSASTPFLTTFKHFQAPPAEEGGEETMNLSVIVTL